MKKLFSLLVIGLALKFAAIAQPTIMTTDASPCTDEEFCVQFTVDDFTDIISMDFTVRWDPEVIQFNAVQGFNLVGLDLGSFNTTNADMGYVTLQWANDVCGANAMGVTIDDNISLFEMCFTAISTYGATTEIAIVDGPPVPIMVTRENTSCTNIGLINVPGLVSTCVRPFRLWASDETGNEGDLVCVDFSVSGFDDLTSMQFTANYDPAVLQFQNIVNPGNLPNLGPSAFGTPLSGLDEGRITVSWNYVNVADPDGITVPDSTVIFQACFRIIGPCESATDIIFTDEPTEIEVTNTVVEGFLIDVYTNPGSVEANECDPPGVQLTVDCGDVVELGDSFCVTIRGGDNFTNVTDLQYLMEWNANILEFTGVNPFLPGLSAVADFNTANVENGILQLSWDNDPLPPPSAVGQPLYEVCFTVVGLGGNSPFNLVSQGAVGRIGNGPNIGINPTNCEIQVDQPEGVTFTISNIEAEYQDEICVDVAVSNFTDIDSLQFSLIWDSDLLMFQTIQNLNFPGASIFGNFNLLGTGSGLITFDWEGGTGLTLDDETVIFQVCFQLVGDPGNCDLIQIEDIPVSSESTSGGISLPLTQQGGDVCILFPEGFYLDIDTVAGDWLDTICVPFRVASFDNIISAQFAVGWDPTAMCFVEAVNTGALNGLSIGTGSAEAGVVTIDYFDLGAMPLADSTVIFELCFALCGAPDACYDIQVNENPAPVVETFGNEGSLLSNIGQVCIDNRLIVVDTIITPASCPDSRDGSIQLVVIGGDDPIGFSWGSTPAQFDTIARNLPPGPVTVTIYDFSSPALILVDTFEIPVLPGAPTVSVPDTVSFNCDAPLLAIQGAGSTGAPYSYEWKGITGGTPDPDDLLTTVVTQPGRYVLEVTNDDTGCSVRDTVNVVAAVFPDADAGADQFVTCITTEVMLDGSASSQGDTVSYLWTPLVGGIAPGEETSQTPTALSAGLYMLEVTFQETGCTAVDTVEVFDNALVPNAFAGEDATIGCSEEATLDGTGSSGFGPLSYQWFNEANAFLSDQSFYTTMTEGVYYLEVTDLVTGCTDRDTVQVTSNADLPVVTIAEPTEEITCVNDTVTLNAAVTNASSFSITWTELDGGQIAPGTFNSLTPKVIEAGVFELQVTNNVNGCTGSAIVTVNENTNPPIAEAGMDGLITCTNPTVALDGSASSLGDQFLYSWTLGNTPIGSDTAATASEPGVYYFSVLDTDNGCTAIDSVEVTVDTEVPVVSINQSQDLNCSQNSTALTSQVVPGGQYQYAWVRLDGDQGIISDTAISNIVIGQPGTYQLTATNPQTGCTGVASITVTSDTTPPDITAGPNRSLDCDDETVTLNADIDSDNVLFNWTVVAGSNGAFLPGSQGDLQAQVISPGTFVLSALDTINGCTARDTVIVNDLTIPPDADAGADAVISCTNSTATLIGLGSDQGDEFTYTWLSPDSVVISSAIIVPNRTQPGFYRLIVTNTETGCTSFDIVEVIVDTIPPVVTIAPPDTLTCSQEIVGVTVSPDPGEGNFSYAWAPLNDGQIVPGTGSTYIAQVTAPDTYRVTVTNAETGCEASAEVEVMSEVVIPEAEAGPALVEFNCAQNFVLLDASASAGANELSYTWQDVDSVYFGTDVLFEAQQPGTYVLTVRDLVLGCFARDTVVVEPATGFPVVDAGPDQTVTCEQDTVTIDAAVSGVDNFDFEWLTLSGGQFIGGSGTTLAPQVVLGGQYVLIATNLDNSCATRDTVVISENITEPVALAGNNFTLDCVDTTFTLNGTGSSSGANLTYTWYQDEPANVVTTGTLQYTVNEPGVYYLEVLDTTNGCFGLDSAIVNQLNDAPVISEPSSTPSITCASDGEVGFAVDIASGGGGYLFEWEVVSGDGMILEGQGTDSIRVNAAGLYSVTVTDPLSSCTAVQEIMVENAVEELSAVVSQDTAFLTCAMTTVTLSAAGSSTGPDIVYQWNVLEPGADPVVVDPQSVSLSAAGVYELVVVDTVTTCNAVTTVTVLEDVATPDAAFEVLGVVTCDEPVATIDASASTGDNLTVTWSGVGVPDPLPTADPFLAEVMQGGMYELIVTNQNNGCADTVAVEVAEDRVEPTADAGADATVNCPGDLVSLDGSASSQGPNITYEWTSLDDGMIVSGAATTTPTVDGVGMFQLLVTNTDNGCTATATVAVEALSAFDPAETMADFSNCGNEATITANLPAGTTGLWTLTSVSGASLATPADASTLVTNLQAGENRFAWTLSTDACPDYSSDTLVVLVERAPVLNDDEVVLEPGVRNTVINPLVNDDLSDIGEYSFNILSGPAIGSIDNATPPFTYSVREGFFGEDVIVYEVCNLACPDLCTTATISIDIQQGADDEVFVPNGITPNGDGLNDQLIFDLLTNADEETYPDNEIVIFNRWGDIVFQAKPYLNDWDGTNESGQELPQGTYYYILRLNIAEGVIIRGDVTIVR